MVCTTLGRVVQSAQSGGHRVEGSMDMDCKLLREAVSGPDGKVTAAEWVNRAGIALQIGCSFNVIDPCTDCPAIATIMVSLC